jgi:hypothetical protein
VSEIGNLAGEKSVVRCTLVAQGARIEYTEIKSRSLRATIRLPGCGSTRCRYRLTTFGRALRATGSVQSMRWAALT